MRSKADSFWQTGFIASQTKHLLRDNCPGCSVSGIVESHHKSITLQCIKFETSCTRLPRLISLKALSCPTTRLVLQAPSGQCCKQSLAVQRWGQASAQVSTKLQAMHTMPSPASACSRWYAQVVRSLAAYQSCTDFCLCEIIPISKE